MKAIKFLQFIPTILILIGISLWTKTLVFDKPTNHIERKLEQFWLANLDRTEPLIIAENKRIYDHFEMMIRRRPDDFLFLSSMDEIMSCRDIALLALERNSSDTAKYVQIIHDYDHQVRIILENLRAKFPIIQEKEIEQVLAQANVNVLFHEPNEELKQLSLRNQILNNNSALLNFFARRGSFSIRCCFGRFQPSMVFNSNLKVGETAIGQIGLSLSPCYLDEFSYDEKYRMTINGVPKMVKDGISTHQILFNDSLSKRLEVETTHFNYNDSRNKIVTDSTKRNKVFTFYPSKK